MAIECRIQFGFFYATVEQLYDSIFVADVVDVVVRFIHSYCRLFSFTLLLKCAYNHFGASK